MTPLSWQAGDAPANGLRLAFEHTGPQHADPVLMIMGLSWQLTEWPDALCSDLAARGLRLVRFDNRDVGLSTDMGRGVRVDLTRSMLRAKLRLPVRADYTLYDMARDTLALMDELSLPRVHIVGVSMGGMIGQLLAGVAPQRVASLTSIMSTTNHPWLPGPSPALLRFMFASGPRDASREAIIERDVAIRRRIGSRGHRITEAELQRRAARAYDRAFRPGGTLRQTHAIVATGSLEGLLHSVRAPTQIIHGSEDVFVRPVGGRRSAKLIRNARLTVIEGMGHDLPDPLLPRIAELIAGNIARA